MRNLLKISLAAFALAVFCAGFRNTPANAQESTAQITPTILEVEILPGETYETPEVIIFNPSLATPQKMEVFINDLTIADESGTYSFVADSNDRYSISHWVGISPQTVNLSPQEPQRLNLTISAPEDAEPGGHYGILLVTATPKDQQEIIPKGAQVKNIGGVGTVLLITVPGEISWEGQVVEFLPVPFLNLGPADFTIRFENTGTVHYSPHGKIELFDFFGGKVSEVEIKPQRVFPGKIRRLEATWERLLLIGRYTAKATIYYGKAGEEKVTSAQIEFWAFPYKAAGVLALTVVVLLAVSRLQRKVGGQRSKLTNARS